jgi:hypothetical protein
VTKKTITVKMGCVDKPNKNGFIIPKKVMEQAIKDKFDDDKIVLGMLGNSADGKIRLAKVTHQIKPIPYIDGDTIVGEILLVGDPDINPDIGIVEAMDEIVCAPCGYGTVKDRGDGVMEVQPGYELISFNIVAPDIGTEESDKIVDKFLKNRSNKYE